ncbi:helix-turn-helix domain-containing protein [Dactylosporangium sp. NPDC006015]|uniref:MarR family transcriptional regulator n=1 Tax=Dactylosporangium sp. NPDC006015 TaxID=3154576 RepID=UPI00339DD865
MTTPATAPKATTADTVARTLADHPTGITVRDLAEAAGVGASTASKALTVMEAAGAATRTPGPANGSRKGADVWHPVTAAAANAEDPTPEADTDPADVPNEATGTANTGTADEVTDTDTTATDDDDELTVPTTDTANEAAVPADDTATPATTANTGIDIDEATVNDDPATVVPVSIGEPTADTEAAVPAAPVAPRKPDLKVMLMAGVLGDHPDGVSAVDAINKSGLAVGVADTILAAMEVAGAAVRRVADDGTETWVLGEADLATVDPANAPTHVTCAACGHTRRIRRASAAVTPRRAGTGRIAPESNSDGSERLMKNGLRNRVEAFMRDLGPGHRLTPGTVARELGRSSGAVGNAMEKLEQADVLLLVNEAPVTYEVNPDAPAPTAPVAALMTAPALAVPAAPDAPATDATTTNGDTATGSAPTGDTAATDPTATVDPATPAAAPTTAPGELIAA